jgi:hypothetical protein
MKTKIFFAALAAGALCLTSCNDVLEEDAKGRIPEDDSGEGYETHSTFESSEEEDFDPNYKIYHEDIYGFNFKKKKNNDGTSDKK